MPLSGCRIANTYFSNKFKAASALLNSAEYKKERVFYFPCLKIWLGHSNSNVPIKVVVYSPAERVEPSPPISPHKLQ
jgi:hypothetical protein